MNKKKRPNFKVSKAARRLLLREGYEAIGYGCACWLHEIYDLCFENKKKSALDKWQYVLNAIDREMKRGCKIFTKVYIRMPTGRMARVFTLRGGNDDKNLFNM